MLDLEKETSKEKHQFRSYYCLECKQEKPCGSLSRERCCQCFYKSEQARAQEYNSYEKALVDKKKSQETKIKQFKLLWEYSGCSQCGSKEVDAYELYENNRLVCQPCQARKEGGSSSPVNFLEQSQWYQKSWGISLEEWLEKFQCLPVSAECAREWLKDQGHLKNCICLKQEAREIYELFTSFLKKAEKRLKNCACKKSEKVRVDSDYYAWCEKCEKSIVAASKKRVIKNRNDPRFWGLKVRERVLCGDCLNKLVAKMPTSKKYTFNKYVKRGYWG